jgi:hypothetical protein
MSEKNTKGTEKTEEKKTQKKTGDQKTKGDVVIAPETARVIKMEWTLERCMKYARRYSTETMWASGSPASYKSALAHGWRDQCVAEMQRGGGNMTHSGFTKKVA